MRIPIAVVTVAVVSLVACGGNSSGAPGAGSPQGTPIRTAPWETTTSAPATTPLPTAYATLPSVTLAPPEWVPIGWQREDVDRFTSLVAEELEALGADAEVIVERGFALLTNGTRIPLTALALRLAGTPVETWREEISAFLVTALGPAAPDDYSDFTAASPLLRVRVGEADALDIDPTEVVVQEIAPGLLAALVIDGPDRKAYVTPAQADVWGKTPAELLYLATGQTLAPVEEPVQDGIFTSLTDDAYAASRILDPATVVADITPNGLLILVPNADVFLAVHITRALDEDTLQGLVAQLQDGYHNRDDPVSDDLYWWHEGTIEVVPIVDDEIQFPESLAQILD